MNPMNSSPEPHDELLIALLQELHFAKQSGARCKVKEIVLLDFQLLFTLEQSLHLSEPCFFGLGVVLSAEAWVGEDQNCTMNRRLSATVCLEEAE